MSSALELPEIAPYHPFADIPHLASIPNVVNVQTLPDSKRALNRGLLSVQETLRRRVKLRFDTEIWLKYRGKAAYKRARGLAVSVSCPNAEQAELLIAAVQDFLASLNGKWLAPKPVEPGSEPSSSK